MGRARAAPCSSTYIPFYDSITSVPVAFTGKTAFNAFRAVAESLDKKGTVGGTTRYGYYIPLVRSVYGTYETECTTSQAGVETTAAGLSGAARITVPHGLLGAARNAGAGPGAGAAGADAVRR